MRPSIGAPILKPFIIVIGTGMLPYFQESNCNDEMTTFLDPFVVQQNFSVALLPKIMQ
jgi:hypothetical protein